MKVLGISPLDKDATVSLVEDGRVLFAAAEERYSRQKQHAGFPAQALDDALARTNTRAEEIDLVAYSFLTAEQEANLMRHNISHSRAMRANGAWRDKLSAAPAKVPARSQAIPGLREPNERRLKGPLKENAYWLLGICEGVSGLVDRRLAHDWLGRACAEHRHWQGELERHLAERGLAGKLKRYEHHLSHAANAYHSSGFERALVVTLDGYGTGLGGSVSLGEGGRLKRLQNLRFPHSLGMYYEQVTAALGFKPDRHAGKIVGLAAYGDPAILGDMLLSRMTTKDGDLQIYQSFNHFFDRYLAVNFPMIDVAAAYQYGLEVAACRIVAHWLEATGCDHVVLSGGVTANVKMNQRIFEIDGVAGIFVYPNMGDGGCGTGLALHASWPGGIGAPVHDVYLGPGHGEAEMEEALQRAGLSYERPNHLAGAIAGRIHNGEVVARFGGRMEYGPRALGNRSILYHGRDPDVNQWLNKRLGRTEFMPFAPVTMYEAREKCYLHMKGAEHTAEFMTITFDCTDFMKRSCPAAVHVDGTARPQLIRREVNAEYYDILAEYEKLSGIPTLINTSFNMHEEPIVCSPDDAIRAFLDGRLDVLALGPFIVEQPNRQAA
jgi:carbamoyltransferase